MSRVMHENGAIDCSSEGRAVQRSNVFIAAIIHGAGGSSPVKIRNLSSTGALVEAAIVPPLGSVLRLVRASLSVTARVVWQADGRYGVRFASAIIVRDWLAGGGNKRQQRIDQAVSLIRAGAVPLPARRAPPLAEHPAAATAAQLAADLALVGRLLDELGTELASDGDIVARHAIGLQSFDIGVQMLSALADAMSRPLSERADCSRVEDLRHACLEALPTTS